MNNIHLLIVVCKLAFEFSLVNAQGCTQTGWFGHKCQYQCHCENDKCNSSTGQCTENTKCVKGWFGLACQYQDLTSVPSATITSSPLQTSNTWITDGDDSTCNQDISLNSVVVAWNITYPFSWLRLTVKDNEYPGNFKVSFREGVNDSNYIKFKNQRIFVINANTVDISCQMTVDVMKIIISGHSVTSLCSVYISGGRNAAVKQTAVQSSTYTDKRGIQAKASNAVDGDTSSFFKKKTCTHTNIGDSSPKWNVTFNQAHAINRIVLYNRFDRQDQCCPKRLVNFSLQTFNSSYISNFSFQDSGKDPMLIYTVIVPVSQRNLPINVIGIRAYSSERILSLCEVQAFEECSDGKWGLECNSTCNTNCRTSCDVENGACPACIGFSNPPLCNTACESRKWGLNCSQNCGTNCYNQSCNSWTGVCNKSCNGYSNPPECTTECTPGTWGRDCKSPCSTHCSNTSCDRKSGICDQGCNGYDNFPDCNKRCRDGAYGINCSKTCSSNCTNSTCDSLLGFCVSCFNYHKGNFCEVIIEQRNEDTTLGFIVESIIAFNVLCVLNIAGFILWRGHAAFKKSKHNPELKRDQRLTQFDQMNLNEIENNYSESNHQENNTSLSRTDEIYINEGISNNVQITMIAVKDLNTFMQSHDNNFFDQQFRSIPAPQNVTTEVGQNSSNKHKNRYKNICAYDHSRVRLEINTLKNEEDYINACYIEGFNKDDKFIASQGPNKIIINDFVRMLWEQQVDKVVMLTNLIEEGTVKCEQYWLDDSSVQFGEIQVRMIATQTFADCVIRFLELSKPREAVAIQTFTHFHFTSWPDKGVPVSPWGLVDFEQRVFAHPTSRPIVVHCSAGVGRTGTFIALRNVLSEAEQTGHVDFFKTVAKLRQDRILMIQTMEQYWFLHKAAQVAIVCIGTTVKSNDIVGRNKSLREKSFTGKTKMEEEFTVVSTVSDDLKEDFDKADDFSGEDGNVYENSEEITDVIKNRFSNIIPKQIYRPFLDCQTIGMSDYINAVVLPGFKKQSQHLLTQLPMPTTVVDFWRLVTQYNVSLIVAFEVQTMVTDKTFGNYSPTAANQELMCSPYVIKSKAMNKAALWEEQLLTVETEKRKSLVSVSPNNNESQTVIHLKCLFTELDPDKLLSFLRQIRSYNALAQGRILYTCSNGAKYSGLACVLSLLLDRMEHDSYLTVPLVVGTVKTIRKEVILNLDQYSVLYDVLARYSDNFVTYDNFGNDSRDGAIVEDFSFNEDQDGNLDANY